jgi:hypothetical protein
MKLESMSMLKANLAMASPSVNVARSKIVRNVGPLMAC